MIDKYLNKAIYILISLLLIVSFLIAFLFVTPVYVHADAAPSKLNVTSSQPDTYTITTNGLFCGSNSYGSVYAISGVADTYVGVSSTNTNLFVASPNYLGNSVWYSNPRYSNYVYPFNSPTYDSNTQLYWSSFAASFTSSDLASFSNSSEFLTAVKNTIEAPQGEFHSLPQVNSSTEIDYVTVAGQGAAIYVDDPVNVYSFLGQYETSVSPTSQYCYVQTGEDAYIPVVFSSVPLTVYRAFINGQTMSSMVCSEYDTGKYYAIFNHFATLDMISPIVPFESLTAAQNAFIGASSGGGAGSASGVVSAGAFSYNVPAGNVLYVRVRPGSLASVTVQMPYISNSSSPAWSNTLIHNYWAMGVNSLPDSNTTFPLSSMTEIVYSPDSSKGLDGYGRSYYGIAQHAPFNGGWFVVYNPAYAASPSMYGGLAGRTDLLNINPTITVNCQYALEYHLFPLSETLTVSGGTSSSDNDYQTSWSGTYDDTTDQFNDTSTQTGLPEVGGNQYEVIQQNNMSISDYLHQLEQTLSDFVNDVSSLLTAPVSHIRNLYNAGANFMTTLISLFSWLPQEVMNIIWSALIVMVAVGVLKLLL